MIRDFRDYLADMLDAANKAMSFVSGMSWQQFAADEKTQFASSRALEIIGEAARNIPPEFRRQVPEIPWQRIVGMRNILAHNYDGADPRVIYDTISDALPDLIMHLRVAITKAEK